MSGFRVSAKTGGGSGPVRLLFLPVIAAFLFFAFSCKSTPEAEAPRAGETEAESMVPETEAAAAEENAAGEMPPVSENAGECPDIYSQFFFG